MDKRNTIHIAEASQFLSSLDSNSIDMILTSPPYDKMRDYKGYPFDFELIASGLFRVLKPGGVLVWVVKDQIIDYSESLTRMRQALYFVDVCGFKLHQTIVRGKTGISFPDSTRYNCNAEYCYVLSKGRPKTINLQLKRNLNAGKGIPSVYERQVSGAIIARKGAPVKPFGVYNDIWIISGGENKKQINRGALRHPATMPEKLAERHILTWSNSGDTILDVFMGSGTTAKMARKHNRHYLGCEISAEYIEIARQRLAIPYMTDMFATPTDDDVK